MKNNLLGEKNLSFSFYLYRLSKDVSYGFPIIIFCNSEVHYEKSYMSFQHDNAANQHILLFISHRVTLNMSANCVLCGTANRL
jgi:hypothetical protein